VARLMVILVIDLLSLIVVVKSVPRKEALIALMCVLYLAILGHALHALLWLFLRVVIVVKLPMLNLVANLVKME